MRTEIVHEGVKHLEYEIRKIVDYGNQLKAKFGLDMVVSYLCYRREIKHVV